MENDIYFLNIAIDEAIKAIKTGDIPIGAVVVRNNKIISKAHNTREKKHNIMNHAEVLAIIKANKKLKTWHLDDCTLYVTMEPCMMCTGTMLQSHIRNVVYCIENEKMGFASKCLDINKRQIINQEYEKIVKNFFKKMRKK